MAKLLQTLLDGTAVGSLYALIALGYTMVYGILKFINFAHSDIVMLGAWLSFAIAVCMGLVGVEIGWSAFLIAPIVLVGTMALCGTIGFTIERVAYKPLRGAPRINVLITAIGVSLFLENCGQLEPEKIGLPDWFVVPFGTRPQGMPHVVPDVDLLKVIGESIGVDLLGIIGVRIGLVDIIVVLTAVALMAALQWVVYGTKLGKAMRAVSFDPKTASLMGINVDAVISITFVVGSVLAAAAGFLLAAKYTGLNQPAAATWVLLGLKAFVAAVIGGIGNIRGAMAGGLLIGMVEMFSGGYLPEIDEPVRLFVGLFSTVQIPQFGIPTQFRDVIVFSLLIVVLLVRPEGLLGRATVEKV